MQKYTFLLILSFMLSLVAVSQQPVALKVNDKLTPAKSVKINGYLENKLEASYNNRILAQDIDKLIHPFTIHDEHNCWQSEFWGKWFTSAALAYNYKPSSKLSNRLKKAVNGLIETQTKDGYIGNYADESRLQSWDIWGRKYCMLGLISYYDITKNKAALEAAELEASFLILELEQKNAEIVKMGNHRGMAASSVLEPICQLYYRTGNEKYLDFAKEIVRQWETPNGPQLISKSDVPVGKRFPKPAANKWYGWGQGQKAYEMMSCYEGLLELYRLTGDKSYKKAVENTWQHILDSEINIAGSGSSVEAWFSGKKLQALPIEHYQETCVTVTWIKFNQQLLRLTGEARYADAIEQAYYNALLGAMRPDGSDWAKYAPLSGQRLQGSEQCGMGLNCCNASGPRGLFTIPLTTVMESNTGIQVNFYADGEYTVKSPKNKKITLTQSTKYPFSGEINLELDIKGSEKMALALRIPQWSKKTEVSVNGKPVEDVKEGAYLELSRLWKKGDKIALKLDMRGKVHTTFNGDAEYKAITRGPIVLARDERLKGPDLGAVMSPLANAEGYIDLEIKESENPDIWMLCSAKFQPESYAEYSAEPIEVEFCDYASAGNTVSTYPFFKVWIAQLYSPRR